MDFLAHHIPGRGLEVVRPQRIGAVVIFRADPGRVHRDEPVQRPFADFFGREGQWEFQFVGIIAGLVYVDVDQAHPHQAVQFQCLAEHVAAPVPLDRHVHIAHPIGFPLVIAGRAERDPFPGHFLGHGFGKVPVLGSLAQFGQIGITGEPQPLTPQTALCPARERTHTAATQAGGLVERHAAQRWRVGGPHTRRRLGQTTKRIPASLATRHQRIHNAPPVRRGLGRGLDPRRGEIGQRHRARAAGQASEDVHRRASASKTVGLTDRGRGPSPTTENARDKAST